MLSQLSYNYIIFVDYGYKINFLVLFEIFLFYLKRMGTIKLPVIVPVLFKGQTNFVCPFKRTDNGKGVLLKGQTHFFCPFKSTSF